MFNATLEREPVISSLPVFGVDMELGVLRILGPRHRRKKYRVLTLYVPCAFVVL